MIRKFVDWLIGVPHNPFELLEQQFTIKSGIKIYCILDIQKLFAEHGINVVKEWNAIENPTVEDVQKLIDRLPTTFDFSNKENK